MVMVIYDLEWHSHWIEYSFESLTFEDQYVHIILKTYFSATPNASAKSQEKIHVVVEF